MENPKVSIIIPVYNTEKYVQDAIESAINQTYDNFEVIAVNDGSTDNSLEIMKKYENKIKTITKTNGGTASALNSGIKEMTGEWFKWLSADDILYPNAVKELISEANKLKNKKKWIIVSNYHLINSNGKIVREFIEPDFNKMVSFKVNVVLLDHFIGNATTCLIHKTAFEEYGLFDEKITHPLDRELWLRFCLLHGVRLWFIPKFLAKYRIHENQTTSKATLDFLKAYDEEVIKSVLEKLDPKIRRKYEKALKHYKRKPLVMQTKGAIRDFAFKVLPPRCANVAENAYRKLRRKEPVLF